MAIVDRIAQWANDSAVNSRRSPIRRFGRFVRKQLLRTTDPLVYIEIDGIKIRAQLSHELPHYRRAHELYAVNIVTLAQVICEAESHPTMVDVGANVGDTVALVRSKIPEIPVLCIEGDPQYSDILKRNVGDWPNVEICAPCLLAEGPGVLAGGLTRDAGSAAFAFEDGRSVVTETLDDVLVKFPRFATPALIKSDTDGFEGRVLAGALRTIDRARPVLFFEYDPGLLRRYGTEGHDMVEMLSDHGYSCSVIYDNFGNARGVVDLQDRFAIELIETLVTDPSVYYLDVAAFPSGKREQAAELYRREQQKPRDRGL